jgi:hypothetical protein
MNVDELPIKYPLDPQITNYLYKFFSQLKDVMTESVSKQMGMQIPPKTVSEICQIFFYVGINIEYLLHDRYKFGIDIVNRNFTKLNEEFREDLINIANKSIQRGVPQDNILEYLCFYYEDVHKKLFPNEPIILG